MEDVIYTVTETAELLKVNRNYVYSLLKSGVIKGLKLGSLKITRTELMRFLEDNNGKDYYIFGSNEEELRLSAESLINPKRVESLESINMLDENGKVKMPILS